MAKVAYEGLSVYQTTKNIPQKMTNSTALMFSLKMHDVMEWQQSKKTPTLLPTNQENWPNENPYMALYWANVLAIVPTLGQFSWFVGAAPADK